jgi:hypothetical protein
LVQSHEHGSFLPEKLFEWNDEWSLSATVEKTIWPGSCRRGRIQASKRQLPYQDLKIILDIRKVPSGVTLGPPVETLRRIIECGGGEVLEVLTGEEETDEEREICDNPGIDYIVRYPCCAPQLEGREEEEDEVLSSTLVSVLLSSYFLDRISMEKVDIREYIISRTGSRVRRRIDEEGEEEKEKEVDQPRQKKQKG